MQQTRRCRSIIAHRLKPRLATLADCRALAELAQSAHSHPWSLQQYRDSIRCGHSCWLLTRSNRRLIACCVASRQFNTLDILDVAVAPQWRRQGVALKLLRQVFAALPEEVDRVLLEVRRSNRAARALYGKLGFKEDGRRKNYYPAAAGGREDAILMSLDRV